MNESYQPLSTNDINAQYRTYINRIITFALRFQPSRVLNIFSSPKFYKTVM